MRDPSELRLLYAAVGELALSQQYVEDSVGGAFVAAEGGDAERASAMYRIVRGSLDQRKLVTAALSDLPHLQTRWLEFAKRIQLSGEFRGKVIHGNLLHWGGGLIVELDGDGNVLSTVREEPPSTQVGKVSPAGRFERFPVDKIQKEIAANDLLHRELSEFIDELRLARGLGSRSAYVGR